MKKSIIILIACLLSAIGLTRAQTAMPLPNGSFEQWTTHPSYSVTVLFFPVNVYDVYFTPTGWCHLSYPVNETTNVMGMNVNINTSIPLVMATPDTDGAPDSNTAARLQSIMISDIVDPTVLSMAGDMIDSSLTNMVFPSILSIGEIDLVALMPLLTNAMSNMDSIMTMLPTLLAMDVNDYVSGGLALGDFRPAALTGSYKYQSATSGDNGGIVIVGTHYNSVTQHRDIVGAGVSLSLTDVSTYTPFTINYEKLSTQDPDSLIVLILSSASANMQQGSSLWIDNLVLWSEPDTCADIVSLSVAPDIHEAVLTWSVTAPADTFEVEYGNIGFTLGNGTSIITTDTALELTSLDADMQYEVYIRSICSDSIYGEWSTIRFTTGPDTCASVTGLAVVGDDTLAVLTWGGTSQPDHWEVEYGEQGFMHGSGTTIETDETRLDLHGMVQAGQLQPDTWYDFHVRAVCDIYGEWASVQYHTPAPAAGIDAPGCGKTVSIYPNPAYGMCTVSVKDGSPARLNLYSPDGRLVATVTTAGAPATLQLPCQGIHLLQVVTPAGISTHKIINAVPTGCPASPTPSSTGC